MHNEARADLREIRGPVHFIGVGGIGMSALARLLLAQGTRVSGSDKAESAITDELRKLGAEIFIGHAADNVSKAEAIVVSTAISKENPELARAHERNLPIFHRSEVLSYLTGKKRLIAVSGTHGKTTTTGMIAQILLDCKRDPSVVVGGIFAYMKSNAHAGKGEFFVAEADESDRSHATLASEIAVVTNIEPDHMENYPGGMEQILSTMASFANKSRHGVVLCQDDEGCRKLAPLLEGKIITYGSRSLSPDAKYTLELVSNEEFKAYKDGDLLGSVVMQVPGVHNKMNALASLAVCMELGLSFDELARAIAQFGGVARRFEHVGEAQCVLVVDDYGHHPTEVRATLEAAQQFKKKRAASSGRPARIVAVFQPHQPGRLRDLWNEFCHAFDDADLLIMTDVYVARGGAIEGISSERFSQEVKHANVVYLGGPVSGLAAAVKPHLKPGDIVLTIGAGDITNLGKPLLALISNEGLSN
jgi:UDP-N-acetylmuramate--alanine ligase